MKFFSIHAIFGHGSRMPRAETTAERARWRRDPLAHPAIDAMSERELADLPLRPHLLPAANEVSCGCCG